MGRGATLRRPWLGWVVDIFLRFFVFFAALSSYGRVVARALPVERIGTHPLGWAALVILVASGVVVIGQVVVNASLDRVERERGRLTRQLSIAARTVVLALLILTFLKFMMAR